MKSKKQYHIISTEYLADYDYGHFQESRSYSIEHCTLKQAQRTALHCGYTSFGQIWQRSLISTHTTLEAAQAELHRLEVEEYNRYYAFEIDCGELQPKRI